MYIYVYIFTVLLIKNNQMFQILNLEIEIYISKRSKRTNRMCAY